MKVHLNEKVRYTNVIIRMSSDVRYIPLVVQGKSTFLRVPTFATSFRTPLNETKRKPLFHDKIYF